MSFRPAFQRVAASRAGLSQFCLSRAQNETRCRANSSYRNEFFTKRMYATGTEQSRATAASQIFKRGEEMYKQRNKTLLMYSTAVILFATGMSYAAVPLYRAFCAATGFAGTPVVGTGKFSPERLVPVSDSRRIRVRFNADTSEALPWQFMPQQKYVDVLPGETSLAFYKARNTAPYDVIGIATYNVTPDRIASYFTKVECFCFEEQKLLAGEEVDMPLLFFIDRDVLEDPACKDVDDIVLSYTFFRARRNASGQLEPDAPEDVVQASLGFDKLSTESASGRSKPGFGIPRRLSKSNRDNHNSNSTAMVDASPQPGRPQQHFRSSFLSFSFAKNRTNSAPSTQVHQPTLSTVREARGSNSTTSTAGNQTDEFGLSVSRPPPQQHQSAPGSGSGPGPSSSRINTLSRTKEDLTRQHCVPCSRKPNWKGLRSRYACALRKARMK
ncbi:COX11_1 [Sanghuangporus weigelae]